MWQVSILFNGVWWGVGPNYGSKDDAEWAIAVWRQKHGSNGLYTGFRVDKLREDYDSTSYVHQHFKEKA